MKPMYIRPLSVESLSDTLELCHNHRNVNACIVFGRLNECADASKEFYNERIEGVYRKEFPKPFTHISLQFLSGSVLRVIPKDMLTMVSHFSYCLFSDTIDEEAYRMIASRLIAYEDPDDLDAPSKELMEFLSSFPINKAGGANGNR